MRAALGLGCRSRAPLGVPPLRVDDAFDVIVLEKLVDTRRAGRGVRTTSSMVAIQFLSKVSGFHQVLLQLNCIVSANSSLVQLTVASLHVSTRSVMDEFTRLKRRVSVY